MSTMPMGLPAGVFGGGMNGALALLLGQHSQRQPQSSYPANPASAGNIFGIGGKTGDFLGKLGDAFLINEGRDPIYAARQKQQAMAEAMSGINDDPEGTIQKVAQIDQKAAAALLELHQQWKEKSKNLEYKGNEDTRQATELSGKGRTILGGMAGASNPATWPGMREQMESVNKRYGVGLTIPKDFDENWVNSTFGSAIDPKDRVAADNLERHRKFDRLDRVADNARQTADDKEQIRHNRATEATGSDNAVSRRISATKPAAGKGGAAKSSGLPSTFVGNKIRNKITGKVAVWNESKGKYE